VHLWLYDVRRVENSVVGRSSNGAARHSKAYNRCTACTTGIMIIAQPAVTVRDKTSRTKTTTTTTGNRLCPRGRKTTHRLVQKHKRTNRRAHTVRRTDHNRFQSESCALIQGQIAYHTKVQVLDHVRRPSNGDRIRPYARGYVHTQARAASASRHTRQAREYSKRTSGLTSARWRARD
jgi:hypothetical protein